MPDNKEVATRFVTEYLNTADEALLGELTVDGYVDHDLPPGVTPHQSISGFRAAFPDARFDVRDVVGEQDKVVVRYRVDGTHTGDFFGFGPTGRSISVDGMSMYRVEDGRLAEAWSSTTRRASRSRSAWPERAVARHAIGCGALPRRRDRRVGDRDL